MQIPLLRQYEWKAQEVVIRANLVVNSLGYHRERRFELRVNKRSNRIAGRLSSADSADQTDPEDPNFFYRNVKYKRGQLVYFLPDPEWLETRDEDAPVTVNDLSTDDWWLGVILDCAELRYKDGTTACALRIAVGSLACFAIILVAYRDASHSPTFQWCYSPDQATELFAASPNSRWAKQLEEHQFWDNEV